MSQTTALPADWAKVLEQPRALSDQYKQSQIRMICLTGLADGKMRSFKRSDILKAGDYADASGLRGSAVIFTGSDASGLQRSFLARENAHDIARMLEGFPTAAMRERWKDMLLHLRDAERQNAFAAFRGLRRDKELAIRRAHDDHFKREHDKITSAVQSMGVINRGREDRGMIGKLAAKVSGIAAEEKAEYDMLDLVILRARDAKLVIGRARDKADAALASEYESVSYLLMREYDAKDKPQWLAGELRAFEEEFAHAMRTYEPEIATLTASPAGDDHFAFEAPERRGVVLDFPHRRERARAHVPQTHAGRPLDL